MIRRPPTRIELKNEDLQEFDYFQKMEKKRTPPTAESQRVFRQERIGYVSAALTGPIRSHFRRGEVTTAVVIAATIATAGASSSQSACTSTNATTAAASTSTAAATAGSDNPNSIVSGAEGDADSGDADGEEVDSESLGGDGDSSLVTATGTPDVSTNMSMDITDDE